MRKQYLVKYFYSSFDSSEIFFDTETQTGHFFKSAQQLLFLDVSEFFHESVTDALVPRSYFSSQGGLF